MYQLKNLFVFFISILVAGTVATCVNAETFFANEYEFVSEFGSHGSGPGQFGTDLGPRGIIVKDGIIFVGDYGNQRIQKFTLSGEYIDHWSSGYMAQLAEKDGYLFQLAPTGSIKKWTLEGLEVDSVTFSIPAWSAGMTMDSDNNLQVSIAVNKHVRKYNTDLDFLGEYSVPEGCGNDIHGSADGHVYFSTEEQEFAKYANDGEDTEWRRPRNNTSLLYITSGGDFAVRDNDLQQILFYDSEWNLITTLGTPGGGNSPGDFGFIREITLDENGYLYVSDGNPNYRIQIFAPAGEPSPTPTAEPNQDCWPVTSQTHALYKFEENALDAGPNEFHGTAHSALWSQDSACGDYAYQNQRTISNYIELPADVLNTIGSSWGIRAHLKLTGHGNNGNELTFLCFKSGINSHAVSIGESPDWVDCSFLTLLDNEHSLCIDGLTTGVYYVYELRYTNNDGYARVFLDNVLQDEVFIGYNPLTTHDTLYVGKGMFGNENRPWWGRIDHLEFLDIDETSTPTPTPTDTPSPTDTPTPEPTNTPIPSDTPTPEPTVTPTATNTPTHIPTNTPTYTPTETPIPPTPTPAPTHSPTPTYPIELALDMPLDHYYKDDEFYLNCHITLHSDTPVSGRFFVLMEVNGLYYYYPSWRQFNWFDLFDDNKDEWSISMTVLDDTTEIVLESFKMPFFPFSMTGCLFMTTFTDKDVTDLIGNIDIVEWGFGGVP